MLSLASSNDDLEAMHPVSSRGESVQPGTWYGTRSVAGQGRSRRSFTPLATAVSVGSSAKLGNTVQLDVPPGTSTW